MARPGFSSLPVELLEEIIYYLASDEAPKSDTGLSAPVRPSRSAWQVGHNDYLAVVACWPRLAPVVEPHLYRDIGIWTAQRLVRLMVRILQRPVLGTYIRSLSCEFDVTELSVGDSFPNLDWDMVDRIFHVAWSSGPESNLSHPLINDDDDDTDTDDSASSSGILHDLMDPFAVCLHEPRGVWAKVLGIILCHAPSLGSLVAPMSGAMHDDPDEYMRSMQDEDDKPDTADKDEVEGSLVRLLDVSARPGPMPHRPWTPAGPLFESLTCVTIKPNKYWGPVDTSSLIVVLLLPNLRRLEVHDDDGKWAHLYKPVVDPGKWPRLEELYLYHSRIREYQLAELCRRCPNLRVLSVHFSMWFHVEVDPDLNLNDALLGLAPSLRSLTLLRRHPGHFLESQPRRLTCLSSLNKLEHLSADFKGLFGPVSVGQWPHFTLEDILPSSLTSLEVVADWSNQLHGCTGAPAWYWTLLRSKTHEVARLREWFIDCRFKNLRHFAISIPPDEIAPVGVEDAKIEWRHLDLDWFEG